MLRNVDDANINTSKHFTSSNNSTSDLSVLGLLYAPTDSRKRKTLEERIIDNLGTLTSSGLNKQFPLISLIYLGYFCLSTFLL